MKRYDHLFEKICDIENLRKAHKNAKKGKGWYKEVQEIDKDPDKYLEQIQEMLINHTYRTSEYEVFYKDDGKKKRKIYKLPYFPDRICQWAILQVIEPCIINNLTTDTYSAIPDRGIHKALHKMQDATEAAFHLPVFVFPAIAFSFVSSKRPPYVIFHRSYPFIRKPLL